MVNIFLAELVVILEPSGRTAVMTWTWSSTSSSLAGGKMFCRAGRTTSLSGRLAMVCCSGEERDSSDRQTEEEKEELREVFWL